MIMEIQNVRGENFLSSRGRSSRSEDGKRISEICHENIFRLLAASMCGERRMPWWWEYEWILSSLTMEMDDSLQGCKTMGRKQW